MPPPATANPSSDPASNPTASSPDPAAAAFVASWSQAGASERANAQPFLLELADLLGVPRPDNSHATGYSFEYPVQIPPGSSGPPKRIDLYKRACFVLEAKQFTAPTHEPTALTFAGIDAGALPKPKKTSTPVRGSGAWDDAMIRARYQAEAYARALPSDEPALPFLLVVDVGHSFEVFADFTQAGKSYLPFPDSQTLLKLR